MKTTLLFLHIALAGLWLGCVLTEILFERALLGQGSAQEHLLAGLHRKVDLFVEIPSFAGVLATGGALLAGTSASTLLWTKIGLGLLAILANVYCVVLVFRRAAAASAGDWAMFRQLDARQHAGGAVVLLGLTGALGLGFWLLAR